MLDGILAARIVETADCGQDDEMLRWPKIHLMVVVRAVERGETVKKDYTSLGLSC